MRLSLNESGADRVIRAIVAVVLVGLALAGVLSGGLAIAAWVVAAILAVTAAVGFCPLYAIFRLSTRRNGR